jgi:glycine/D-amino acid oxidase-like deaminating enzyme
MIISDYDSDDYHLFLFLRLLQVRALWKYANSLGCETISGAKVVKIGYESKLTVTTSTGDCFTADKLVVAPGGWISKLSKSLGINIPTRVSDELVSYWEPKESRPTADISYKSMPTFIVYGDNGMGPFGWYGLPQIDIKGVKCSAHYCGPTVDPDARPDDHQRLGEVLESTRVLIDRMLPGLDSQPTSKVHKVRCLYTITPDHDFVLGLHPKHPNICWMGGGSGHGFKFGPALGEVAVRFLLKEPQSFPIPPGKFSPDRFEKRYGPNATFDDTCEMFK